MHERQPTPSSNTLLSFLRLRVCLQRAALAQTVAAAAAAVSHPLKRITRPSPMSDNGIA